ncbi:MAG: hypothetical protein ACREPA_10205 [Candidatus Dormibacteraceae bacterium]
MSDGHRPGRAHHFHLCLSSAHLQGLRELAGRTGLPMGAVIRQLLEGRITTDGSLQVTLAGPDAGAALAALIAAEHTLALLKTIVPEGELEAAQLGETAALAAQARLVGLRQQLEAARDA